MKIPRYVVDLENNQTRVVVRGQIEGPVGPEDREDTVTIAEVKDWKFAELAQRTANELAAIKVERAKGKAVTNNLPELPDAEEPA